jgi:hypothetical protein
MFSPDSRHVAFAAQKGQKRVVVVDGRASEEYDGLGPPIFAADGVLEYLAMKEGSLYHVQYAPVR